MLNGSFVDQYIKLWKLVSQIRMLLESDELVVGLKKRLFQKFYFGDFALHIKDFSSIIE